MSPPGSRHGALTTRMAVLLDQHARPHNLGTIMIMGGFKLATNPDTVREPDLAFVRRDRIPGAGLPDGFWPGAPDLAVEIRSPVDRQSEVLAKVHDYLARGVRLVWVVDPKERAVTVHRPQSPPVALGAGDVLDGGDVLAGFSCEVGRIFE